MVYCMLYEVLVRCLQTAYVGFGCSFSLLFRVPAMFRFGSLQPLHQQRYGGMAAYHPVNYGFWVWVDVIDALGEAVDTGATKFEESILRVPDGVEAVVRAIWSKCSMYKLSYNGGEKWPYSCYCPMWYRAKATMKEEKWLCKLRVSLSCHPLHTRPAMPAPLSLCVNGACMSYGNNCQKDLTVKGMTLWCSSIGKCQNPSRCHD